MKVLTHLDVVRAVVRIAAPLLEVPGCIGVPPYCQKVDCHQVCEIWEESAYLYIIQLIRSHPNDVYLFKAGLHLLLIGI